MLAYIIVLYHTEHVKKIKDAMIFWEVCCSFLGLYLVIVACLAFQGCAHANQTSNLLVDASNSSGRPIPDTLFGIFFEVGKDYGVSQELYNFQN